MRVISTQMKVKFADVKFNLTQAKRLVKQASRLGAELVLLPEFFTSAIGYSEQMLNVAIQSKQVHNSISEWANRYQIIVGGSYISYENENAYNLFELIFPDGETFSHKKDIPTQFENCYYTNGDKNNILKTPIGNIGVALCWEMIRYDTLKRILGNVYFVLAGSCWWDLPKDAQIEREPLRKYNQNLALETPVEFAKLLHVPVVHANHCGKVTAFNFPSADRKQTRQYVGAAQIIDEDGYVIDRHDFTKGEGIVIADLKWNTHKRKKVQNYSDKYWIPDLPDSYINAWETINPQAKEYYETVAVQYYKNGIYVPS